MRPSFLQSRTRAWQLGTDLAINVEETLYRWALSEADGFFSQRQWEKLQLKRLTRLIRQARMHVPYWSNQLSASHNDLLVLQDSSMIPSTTRRAFKKADIRDLVDDTLPSWRFVKAATSGSTAEPFSFFQDARTLFVRRYSRFYELSYASEFKGPSLVIGLHSLKHLHGLGFHVVGHNLEDNAWRKKEFYPGIQRICPRSIISTPSYLRRLAYHLANDDVRLEIESIRFYGEGLPSYQRELLENFFGCPIYGIYGSQECSLIALQCKDYAYHVAPWMTYVEVIDAKGRLVPEGEIGNLAVTSLENECMPFIRYQIGDRGKFLKYACSCGRGGVIQFEGRTADLLEFKDGTAFPIHNILHYFGEKFSSYVDQFQLEMREHNNLLVRYVSCSAASSRSSSYKKQIQEYLESVVRGNMSVTLEVVDTILPQISGKTPILIHSGEASLRESLHSTKVL
ncbi:MAG: hypothetical protein A3A28_04395 [Candidatus Sungbacteria bacterium RIFCSPLOWO2_01_FULL_47_32]|nr:MAG: hypothetical protein A3D57_00865 [Candidatus Sungbacteria bacterium RIFCSPHIGHO2_02_FULL_46_12]OHA05655.1 MAG: hypothetical protein A3A28_04395 [Candidatus Sungbacteria bacterium RIFCSPLOWO2_01_FULL_47_32]